MGESGCFFKALPTKGLAKKEKKTKMERDQNMYVAFFVSAEGGKADNRLFSEKAKNNSASSKSSILCSYSWSSNFQRATFWKLFLRKNSRKNRYLLRMNKIKLNVYKNILQEVCEKFDGAEEFINQKIEETCCHEKLSVEEVTYFVYERLCFVVSF